MSDKKKPVGQLRVDSVTFERVTRAVIQAVSTDTERAHLNSMHVVVRDGRLVIEGTDGFCLAIWEIEGEYPDFDVKIPRERVLAFIRALPTPTSQVELFEDGYVRVEQSALLGHGVRIDFQEPENDYPDLTTVIPKRHKGELACAFSIHPTYLEKAGKVFASLGGKDAAAAYAPLVEPGSGPRDAIRFTTPQIPAFLFVCMPMTPRNTGEVSAEAPVTAVAVSSGSKTVTLTAKDGERLRKTSKKDREASP